MAMYVCRSKTTKMNTTAQRGALLLWGDLPSDSTDRLSAPNIQDEERLGIPGLLRTRLYSAFGRDITRVLAWYNINGPSALPAAQIDMEEVFERLHEGNSASKAATSCRRRV